MTTVGVGGGLQASAPDQSVRAECKSFVYLAFTLTAMGITPCTAEEGYLAEGTRYQVQGRQEKGMVG